MRTEFVTEAGTGPTAAETAAWFERVKREWKALGYAIEKKAPRCNEGGER